jgi:hypothetical protein
MGNHVPTIVSARCSESFGTNENGRADPLPLFVEFWILPLSLFLIDGFLQFGPRGKLCYFARGDFDRGARLRIAPVARLSLRH